MHRQGERKLDLGSSCSGLGACRQVHTPARDRLGTKYQFSLSQSNLVMMVVSYQAEADQKAHHILGAGDSHKELAGYDRRRSGGRVRGVLGRRRYVSYGE